MAVGESNVLADDADISHEGYGQAGADSDAIYGGDDGLVAVDNVQDDVARVLHGSSDLGIVTHHAPFHCDVSTGAERPSCAGDDRHPCVWISAYVEPNPPKIGVHLLVSCVVLLGAVDR